MTKPIPHLLLGAAILAPLVSAFAQDGAAPAVTAPPATTERVTGADPSIPVRQTGAAAARTAVEVARTRRLVRAVNENTDNIKANGLFGAQLWLVQGRQFFEDWKKPEAPTIDPIEIVNRGQQIFTAVIFYGTARDGGGLSNVTYDLVVKRPDGTIYDRREGAIGYQDLAPADDRQIQLGRDSLGITIGENDPAGLYAVTATVRDNVGRVSLPLTQHFVVR